MTRKLTESDRNLALAFLKPEAAINLFMIGDIEQDGFDQPFQEFWGSFNSKGELIGILVRYEKNYIPYSPYTDFDYSSFINIIQKDDSHHAISGKGSIMNYFQSIFTDYQVKQTYFCQLTKAPLPQNCAYEIKKAVPKDASRICKLLNEIEEFDMSPSDSAQIERILTAHSGRVYYTESPDGTLQNVVQSTAENSMSAMIVGVATRKAFRRQGLMRSCLSQLCYDLIHNENKNLCLFYDNPEAGRIYHSLGFETIDKWTMLMRPEH